MLGENNAKFFEINNSNENTVDLLNKFIGELSLKTNRNVIIYYSGWLSTSPEFPNGIDDSDKNGFMAMF